MKKKSGKTVDIIGAGGNIGSHLLPHLARIPDVGRVILIDKDIYEEKNIFSQDIKPRDVGKPKVAVQARRLLAINPDLEILALHKKVENIPLGLLRADLILACLDSRRARQVVNRIAFRLGVPWIDAGVDGKALLAKVAVYIPGEENPCLECGWDERDYEALEQAYPCLGQNIGPEATNAPSSLGALAASIQAIEAAKILKGEMDSALVGRQVLIDARSYRLIITNFRRRKDCRLDHERWSIQKLSKGPREITLRQALLLGGDKSSLSLEEMPFTTRLTCRACGTSRKVYYLIGRLGGGMLKCGSCRKPMVPVGFEMMESIKASDVPKAILNRPLSNLGFQAGDIMTINNGGEALNFQLKIAGNVVFKGAYWRRRSEK